VNLTVAVEITPEPRPAAPVAASPAASTLIRVKGDAAALSAGLVARGR